MLRTTTRDIFWQQVVVLCCFILLPMIAACGPKPDPRHYKLTAYVKTPEGTKTGSGVIQVERWGDIKQLGWMGTGGYAVAGEAFPVDLPGSQALWILVANKGSDGNDWAAYALDRSLPASGPEDDALPMARRPRAAPRPLNRRLDLPAGNSDNYPYLVRFRNPADPLSMEIVDPDNVAASFGPGFALEGLTVQETDEPVSRRLRNRLTPAFFDRWSDSTDRFGSCRDVDHPFMRRAAFTVLQTAFSQPLDTVPGNWADVSAHRKTAAQYSAIPCNRLIPGFSGDSVRRLNDTPVFTHHVDSAANGPVAFAEWTPGKVELDSNFAGTLGLASGCLTLNGLTNPMLLVFPRGEAHWNDRRHVLTFRDKDYRLGDRIDLLGVSHYLYVDGGKVDYPGDAGRLGDFAFKRCNGFDIWLVK